MIKKTFCFNFLICLPLSIMYANNSKVVDLEQRIAYLENKVEELELKVSGHVSKVLWKDLKRGVSKTKIRNSYGNPDRTGKYSNGDELWGFQNYTLKFDRFGKLKNWSKPFAE